MGEVEGDRLDRVMAMPAKELHEPSLHSAKRDKATLIMNCWTGSTNQGESRQNSEASLSCLQSPVRRWARPYQTAHPGKARPPTGRSGELLEPGPPQDLIWIGHHGSGSTRVPSNTAGIAPTRNTFGSSAIQPSAPLRD